MWFIDTDNVVRIEGLRNVVTEAYINNATITGILYGLPTLVPTVDGVAVDKGAGKVGIPCVAHGQVSGGSIRIERSVSYNNDFMVDVTTSVDELVITATYAAETFTGEEFIYTAVVGTVNSPITFSYVATSDGDYVGKLVYTAPLIQDVDYVMCIKEVSGAEQVVAKIIQTAGFQGL